MNGGETFQRMDLLTCAFLGFSIWVSMELFTCLTTWQLDLRRPGILFLLLNLLLHYCENKPTGCAMPDRNDAEISLSFCSLRELPELSDFKSYENMRKFNVSNNDITRLDPDLFKYNPKLVDVDLSYNRNLGSDYQGTECIIKSESILKLNFAHTGYGLIQPESICAPKLRHINLVGVNMCEQTRELFKEKKPSVRVTCGGSGPEATSEGTTLSPLNTHSSTISGPTKRTGDSASHGPTGTTSMTNSGPLSGDTTQQPGTASPPPASANVSEEGVSHKDLTPATTEPNQDNGTPIVVWIVIGIVIVIGIGISLYRFRDRIYRFFCSLRNAHFCELRNFFRGVPENESTCENKNANTGVHSENSPGDKESDTEAFIPKPIKLEK